MAKPIPNRHRRWLMLQMVWPLCFLLMVGVTFRLWLGTSSYPQIPLLQCLVGSSVVIDWFALAGACVSALSLSRLSAKSLWGASPHAALGTTPTNQRILAASFTIAMLLLFCTNQHRLQPWAWQFVILSTISTLSPTRRAAITAARWVVAWIYIYSALSKFDYQFLAGLGRQFVAVILTPFYQVNALTDIPVGIVWALPLGELLLGTLLLFSKTRRAGVCAAAVLHISLLIILGPWGMGHHWGVLVWNVVFAGITTILFWPVSSPLREQTNTPPLQPSLFSTQSLALKIFTVAVLLFPILPSCDHWLAWGLYSTNNRRCIVSVILPLDREAPEQLAPYLSRGAGPANKIDIGKMTLDHVGVPIYPEARFQAGVGKWLQQQVGDRGKIVLDLQSKSDRWTGRRTVLGDSTGAQANWQKQPMKKPFFFNNDPR